MTEVVLYHHVQGLTEGVRVVRRRVAAGGAHRAHARPVRRAHVRHDRGGHGLRARSGVRRAGRARGGRRRRYRPRSRLRRLLLRRHGRPAARADPARRPRRLAHVLVPPGLGVRGRVARGRPGAGARQGGRPVLRRGPRGRAGPRRLDRPGRAVPLPGRGAPLRRLLAPGVRRRRCGVAHRARAGVPRRRFLPTRRRAPS